MEKSILLITTRSEGVTASQVRMRYFRQALEHQGYTIIDFEVNLNGLNKYLYYLHSFPPKDLIVKSKSVDLIIATSPTLINAILAHKVARKLNTPLIIDIRDLWEEYAKTAHFLLYKIGVIRNIVKEYYEALKYAARIFVVTKSMRRYYEDVVGVKGKVIVISNGTDVDLIKCCEIKRTEDLICLADLNRPYHNLEFLFEALEENDLRLFILGGGSLLPRMKERVQKIGIMNRVSFVGWVPYENLASYLCRAKVGVVGRPFINNIEYLYTIPVKTYDYLAAGLAIAGYGPKNSALEEFIEENVLGCYVSEPSPSILSEELIKLVERSDDFRRRARGLALDYDRKRIAQRVVEVVNDLVK
ncbi:MAG: glycosyltransferase [Candidatus Bathyarchaeia archaeon]